MLKIYGIQLFLPRTKIKDTRSCRPHRQPAVYAHTCAVTSSFFGSHLPSLICIGQLIFFWFVFLFCFAFLLTSLASLLPFCCLRMPSSRGEAYLQRLGGKGRLRRVLSSLTVSVALKDWPSVGCSPGCLILWCLCYEWVVQCS